MRNRSLRQLQAAAEEMKGKATVGQDGLPYEVLKNVERAAIDALLQIINDVWEMETYLLHLIRSVVVPIPKPGKPSPSLHSLRPISPTPTVCRLYENIVATRLNCWL